MPASSPSVSAPPAGWFRRKGDTVLAFFRPIPFDPIWLVGRRGHFLVWRAITFGYWGVVLLAYAVTLLVPAVVAVDRQGSGFQFALAIVELLFVVGAILMLFNSAVSRSKTLPAAFSSEGDDER